VGELNHWSPLLFSREGGGGGALVGIFWFPIVLGPYFAWRLCRRGKGPASSGRAVLFTVLGIVVAAAGGFIVITGSGKGDPGRVVGMMVAGFSVTAIGALIQRPGWPALSTTLLAYGFAARLPIALLMFFAMRGGWGTHYDGEPLGFPTAISFGTRYLVLALLPQLTFWIAYTVLAGAFVGTVATTIWGWRE